MRRGGRNAKGSNPAKKAGFGEMKQIERLYIGAGWALSALFFIVGASLLVSVPAQARPFMVEQALAAVFALVVGSFLLHAFADKRRLAGARASLERDPLGFVETHNYGRSLRADGEFESLTARMSVLCRLYSIVSSSFAEVFSSYLKLYRKYEPNSVQWRASVRSLDEKVQTRFAGKLAVDERAFRQLADEGRSEKYRRAEDLATEDESRAAAVEESISDE